MKTEYEATFIDVDKDDIRRRLKGIGAALVHPEVHQHRITLHPPHEKRAKGVFVRVRDEGDKITMSWKSVKGDAIENQKEVTLVVDNFDAAMEFLELLGCERKSYQETKRELWQIDGTDVTIDEWPFLEPMVEIEGSSEESVRRVAASLGFDWSAALFCTSKKIYRMKYGEDVDINTVPRLIFDMKNPFVNS